jgi:hypothetical protein
MAGFLDNCSHGTMRALSAGVLAALFAIFIAMCVQGDSTEQTSQFLSSAASHTKATAAI